LLTLISISLNVLTATAQLSTPKELISIVTGLIIGVRSVGGTVGLAIFHAIFSATQNNEITAKVGHAIEAFPKFDPSNTSILLDALETQDTAALDQIPGVTTKLLDAVSSALQHANILAFRNVWITCAAFCGLAIIGKTQTVCLHLALTDCCSGSAFLVNPKAEFTRAIDAPIETKEELQRSTMMEKLSHRV
jgi:hypothetical protein